ncbi:MAG: enoyl-CoA hydratase-related protein [Dehalococcoidales bacterium]|nr:enoyl-CoA hydratase-related protein [Dehalococcoidales bacterium]
MTVDYIKEGRIATFVIDRPEALNSIDLPVFQELSERLTEFRDDPDLWVGIVTGARSRAFSIGADIKNMLPFAKENRAHPWAVPPSIMRGLDMWKPLIAAVNGVAFGGGLEIMLACDIRIVVEGSRFGTPEVGLGLIPGWGGTQRLPRMVPWCKAAELLLMGRPVDAAEAYRIGLVNKVVPREQLLATAKEWAEAICKAGPLAVRAAKEAMVRGSDMSLDDGLRLENALESYCLGTEDFSEGTGAFVEKRKPEYKGK